MVSINIEWLGLMPLLLLLAHPISAFRCLSSPPQLIHYYYREPELLVANQSDLDAINLNCTIALGDIITSYDYEGPFVLNGVLNATVRSGSMGSPNLTSFEMKEMKYGSISFKDTSSLRRVSLPQLESAGEIIINSKGDDDNLISFPSLLTAHDINIWGNFSKLRFPILTSLTGELRIGVSDVNASMIGPNVSPRTLVDLDFPTLQNASLVDLVGYISSISFPSLATVGSPPTGFATPKVRGDCLSINNYGDPLLVDFPNLLTTRNMRLGGSFSRLSFPFLTHVPDMLQILATSSLSVVFSNISEVTDIYLQGKINHVSFPNLHNVSRVYINSDMEMDCSSKAIFGRGNARGVLLDCTDYSSEHQPYHFYGNALLGVILGSILVGTGLLALFLRIMYRLRRKSERQKEPEINIPMEDAIPRDDPPEYSSVTRTEVGSVHSDDTAVPPYPYIVRAT